VIIVTFHSIPLTGSLSEDDRQKMKCYGIVEEGVVKLNYTAYVVFMQRLPGTLTRELQLRATFFDAFTDIGSQQARSFLAAKLRRAESDPAAAHLRSEVGGSEALTLADVDASIQRLSSNLSAMEERLQASMKNSLQALIPSISATVCHSLAQKFKDLRDEVRAVVCNPKGSFIEALRKAVKLPAMKRTTNSEKFPDGQRATPDEERFVESLSTLLTEELEQLASQGLFRGGRLSPLSYGAWKRCRSLVGSRCLALRKLTGDASKPLLWSNTAGGGRFNGGGQHYVYLKDSRSSIGGNAKDYLRRVLKQKLKKSRQSPTIEEHIRLLIASTPPETWPLSSSDVDAFQHDASEERLGAEMER